MKLSPHELARQSREWHGSVPLSDFDRLSVELRSDDRVVDVKLAFSRNENGHVRMKGFAAVEAVIACHRCSESVPTTIRADVDALVVRSIILAKALAQESDVIIAAESSIAIAELIEDDLIMSVPWRVCENADDCPRFSANPLDRNHDETDAESTQKPFANLRQLLNR